MAFPHAATKCSHLCHLATILYYALNHFTIIIIFCCTEHEWHFNIVFKSMLLLIWRLKDSQSSVVAIFWPFYTWFGLKRSTTSQANDSTFYLLFWHNSLVLEVTYYVQNNASLMWKSLIVLYHTAEGRGGVSVTCNATCTALSFTL